MFWAGVVEWWPIDIIEQGSLMLARQMMLENSYNGFLFCISLLGILTAHELGHFFVARLYGIWSTPPIFLPFPLNPIGTCGAVIAMRKHEANRKQLFDIGIAGPMAGLAVIVPLLVIGLMSSMTPRFQNAIGCEFSMPLIVQLFAMVFHPGMDQTIPNSLMNPFLMAAWAGLLVTGINMVPMSQLDGGHVAFGLLGQKSYFISYVVFGMCIAYVILLQQWAFVLMLILVYFMGTKHPPSSDDTIPIGRFRQVIGWLSLVLPILCVPINPIQVVTPY